MLTKAAVLQELNHAKIAHTRWVKRAEHLISGLPVDKEFIPLEATGCGFGKWLYGPVGEKLRLENEFQELIEEIEQYHDDLHDIYAEIYKIYFVLPKERSLWQKVITFNSKEPTEKEKSKAKTYFASLQHTSEELLMHLKRLEVKVRVSHNALNRIPQTAYAVSA